jgi:hypothetical protein
VLGRPVGIVVCYGDLRMFGAAVRGDSEGAGYEDEGGEREAEEADHRGWGVNRGNLNGLGVEKLGGRSGVCGVGRLRARG